MSDTGDHRATDFSDEPIILSRCCPTCDALAAEVAALRKDAQCYHHLVGLIRANRTAFAGEVLDWFTGESHE